MMTNEFVGPPRELGFLSGQPLLTQAEINDRIERFNLSCPYDWTLFEGVAPEQQVDFLYPFTMKVFQ